MVRLNQLGLLLTLFSSANADFGDMNSNLRRSLATDTSRNFNYSYAVRKIDPNGERLDNFGRAVAISNGLALVGSPEDDDNVVAEDAGAVFVFVEDSDNSDWRLIRQLEDGEPGDYFGWSVALHTDGFAVIGACRGNRYGKFSGGAYTLFIEKDPYGDQAIPEHITPTERHGNQYYGFSVAISTNRGHIKVAIGAYGHRGKGAVFIYNRKPDGTLTDEKILYGSDSVYDDKFGWSVDIYHDIVIAGAPMDNNQGSAYVFAEGSDGSYTQLDKLSQTMLEDDANNPLYGDYFGMTVTAGNGFVAIASPHNDVRASDAGAVYVYTRTANDDGGSDTFQFSQALFAPDAAANYRFGWSMDYDPLNDRLAVGVDFSRLTSYTGQVYMFALSTTNFFSWETTIYPVTNANDDYEEPGGANFGFAVSIYGDYLAIGSEFGHGQSDMTGDVYFFRAQNKKEWLNRKKGITSDEEVSVENSAFGTVGLALLIVVPLCGLIVLFMWFRYKSDGENEGFGTYVADELADAWDRMTAKKNSRSGDNALRFMEEDDSQHSTHPMMDTAGSQSEGSGSREKKSRSKLSGLKSGSSQKGASYSKSSRSGLGSSSSKRAAGYTSANVDDI